MVSLISANIICEVPWLVSHGGDIISTISSSPANGCPTFAWPMRPADSARKESQLIKDGPDEEGMRKLKTIDRSNENGVCGLVVAV